MEKILRIIDFYENVLKIFIIVIRYMINDYIIIKYLYIISKSLSLGAICESKDSEKYRLLPNLRQHVH